MNEDAEKALADLARREREYLGESGSPTMSEAADALAAISRALHVLGFAASLQKHERGGEVLAARLFVLRRPGEGDEANCFARFSVQEFPGYGATASIEFDTGTPSTWIGVSKALRVDAPDPDEGCCECGNEGHVLVPSRINPEEYDRVPCPTCNVEEGGA